MIKMIVRYSTLTKKFKIFILVSSLLGTFLYSSIDAIAAPPTERKVKMKGYTLDGESKGAYTAATEVGWEYAFLETFGNDDVYLEKKGTNLYKIRVAKPRWANYNYWTVSARGYVYLGEKSYSETFRIVERSDGYYNIYDSEKYPINTSNWALTAQNYISAGEASGWHRTKWSFE